MSYRKEKSLRHLKAVADNFRSTNPLRKSYWHLMSRRVDYSARDLFKMVKESSESAKRRNRKIIARFVRHYDRDAAQDMNHVQVPRLLEDYMRRLDKLFFFSLLTRRVRKSGIFGQVKALVELKVRDTSNREMSGYWDPSEDRINVWARLPNGERERFATLIDTLAHEMVHAFLDIFADDTHDKHHLWVDTNDGHGEMFWALHHYILHMICSWLTFPASQELRLYRDLAHDELQKARRFSRAMRAW